MSDQAHDEVAPLLPVLATGRVRCRFVNDGSIPATWRLQDRCMPEGHLLLLERGRLVYDWRGQERLLEAGSLVLVGPGLTHGGRKLRPGGRFLTCRFALEDASGALLPLLPVAAHWQLADPEPVTRLWRQLHRHWRRGADPLEQAAADHLLQVLLIDLLRRDQSRTSAIDHAVADLLAELGSDPGQRPRLDQLARRAGCSRRTFVTRFRACTGTSPIAWHIGIRCRRAAELLVDSDASLAAIAADLGYADAFVFSKQFRSRMGCAPSAYRRRWRGGTATRPDDHP